MRGRPRVLFLTHRLPYAPNRGDRIRAYYLLRALTSFADVDVVSLTHDAQEDAQQPVLAPLVGRVMTARVPWLRTRAKAAVALFGSTPLTHVLLDSPALTGVLDTVVGDARPDVVYAYCSGVAPAALAPPLSDVPLLADLVDIDSRKWRDLAATAPPWLAPIYRREASLLGHFEERLIEQARSTFVVSEREREALTNRDLAGRLTVLPNGIDIERFTPPAGTAPIDKSVVFTAVFDYPPNESGALWLLDSVWPQVRARNPAVTLTLAGANPTRRLRAAASRDPSVTVTGSVPDIRPFLWRAAVAAAPLHVSRGVQNKVLEALAAGLPCVTTSSVLSGLPESARRGCVGADDAGTFADALLALVDESPESRRDRVATAAVASLGWDAMLSPLQRHVELAVR